MRFMTIASGSSGNCIYVGSDNTHILIDAGVSKKKICEGLKAADLDISDISAVFITHEHIDHVKGAGVLMRGSEIPFYGTSSTLKAMGYNKSLGPLSSDRMCTIDKHSPVYIGDLCIEACHISHDASDPVAYTVSGEKEKAGVVTDLGDFDEEIVEHMSGCDVFLAEANHDIRMLETGPYPYALKRRILGDRGHLSNEASGDLINALLNDHIKAVFLGHLSKENNYDRLAYETVRQSIDTASHGYRAGDFHIEVAKRDTPSTIIEV